MRGKKLSLSVGLAILMALSGVTVFAAQVSRQGSIQVKNEAEAGLPDLAKLTFDDAIKAAVAAVPGKALRVELEHENGYVVYGVEVVGADHQITDVKVDAGNGDILKTDRDQNDKENHVSEHFENGHETED